LFHDLEGGEIAAERPPPPGAGQPYPHVGLVPAKPVMPDPAFRTALQNELATERDEKEVMAAGLPTEKIPPPPAVTPPAVTPPPVVAPPAPAPPAASPAQTPLQPASAVPAPPGPNAAPATADDTAANATIAAAEPPPKPAAPPPPPPAPSDASLQIVGEPVEEAGLPLVPDAPPPPATFEGVPAEPAPTLRLLPPALPPPAGTAVYFAQGSDQLSPSQLQSVKDIASHRKTRSLLITGLGEAESDSPVGQEAAIDLGLKRARTIARAFADLHVPQGAMQIAAQAFGRGAVVRLLP
jgi:outer membrane protein OmpA-like peptidoglycan-associated protein